MCALLRGVCSVGSNPTRQLLLRPEVLWSSSGGNEWAKAFKEKATIGGQRLCGPSAQRTLSRPRKCQSGNRPSIM